MVKCDCGKWIDTKDKAAAKIHASHAKKSKRERGNK